MPKSHLWGLNESSEVFSLSSWDNYWQKFDSSVSKINQFISISSSLWSIWGIGIDNQVYMYVPSSEIKIRTVDIIIENQRRDFSRYSGRNLRGQDPPEFVAVNYYGKLIKSDFKTFALPSTRWKWENTWKVKKTVNDELSEEGWVYSSNFMQKFHNHPNRFSNAVRRRYWQRYRCFHASERWLLIAQETAPFEVTCNQGNDAEIGLDGECDECVNSKIVHIGCGGEMLPHQKDGFTSVWIINDNGQVLYRLDVHRQNPEGSHWCVVKLPTSQKALCLSVGPLGHILVHCSNGSMFFRENVTWKNPIGSSWMLVRAPEDLIESETIAQVTMSVFVIWARSSNNRVWFRNNVNLHESCTNTAIGTGWVLAAYNISWICSSPSGQLWGLPVTGNGLLYRLSSLKMNKTDRFWSGYIELGFVFGEQDSLSRLVMVCGNGFFVEDDAMPCAWIHSPTGSRGMNIRNQDENWRSKIIDSLIIRDCNEFKNPSFSNFVSISEQVSWSKASDCQAQKLLSNNSSRRWWPANLVLHHKLKDGQTLATLHISFTKIGRSNIDTASYIESDEMYCVTKHCQGSKRNTVQLCSTLVIFFRKNDYRTCRISDRACIPRLLFQFTSENDVEDWILALNFVMSSDRRNNITRTDVGKIWFINKLYEPFSVTSDKGNMCLSRLYQHGGHFKIVESCAKGRITWALGFNGIAWINTKGRGGSYLGLMCSSKDFLNTTFDAKSIVVLEYEKLKLLPGFTLGKFNHYMWTDEYDNIIRDKECIQLASKRWQWCDDWKIDNFLEDGQYDNEGWQYSTSLNHRFDSHLTWNKSFRRRRWIRNYKTSMTGPWKEIINELMRIIDISLSTDFSNGVSDSCKCVIWAITESGLLFRRRGVTMTCPEGFEWIQVRTNLKLLSVSVNKECDLWVVCRDGSMWRLKNSVNRTATSVDCQDWEVVKHASDEGRFIKVSSGDQYTVWAIDADTKLWVRIFKNMTNPGIGDQWVLVCDQVIHVSCASQQRVFVLFATGSMAERVGITTKIPQGTDWRFELYDIVTYVSIRGA